MVYRYLNPTAYASLLGSHWHAQSTIVRPLPYACTQQPLNLYSSKLKSKALVTVLRQRPFPNPYLTGTLASRGHCNGRVPCLLTLYGSRNMASVKDDLRHVLLRNSSRTMYCGMFVDSIQSDIYSRAKQSVDRLQFGQSLEIVVVVLAVPNITSPCNHIAGSARPTVK